jgi:hypothetical protein
MPIPIEFPLPRPSATELAHKLGTEPLKRCSRLTKAVDCCLCEKSIRPGEHYRALGYRTRGHEICIVNAKGARY